jgi:transcriptional regulator with XRE-family HTH domain
MASTARVASRIRGERARRRWSLDDLAGRAGVSKAMISKIERGETSPTAALLGALSAAFGITLSAFFADSSAATAARCAAPNSRVARSRDRLHPPPSRRLADHSGRDDRVSSFLAAPRVSRFRPPRTASCRRSSGCSPDISPSSRAAPRTILGPGDSLELGPPA